MVTLEQKREIEEMLYREAHLLDEHRYQEWLELFTDDVDYVIPLREHLQGEVPPAGHPVVKDDKIMLTARVKKHETGFSHVEVPKSMTCHLVTNILVEEGPSADEVEVVSSFIVRQARKLRDEAWWAGRRRDLMRRVDGQWKIARREVILDAPIYPRSLSIFF
ncbi:MAG TPA: aromatic-ring-hydroxylating dioxygenase subunit beta [Dehalococcoidia bacterium]|nr:aromatic-ring-hydroxylating dioxygenase subunit beta [Dehalococcoidia bacterium]